MTDTFATTAKPPRTAIAWAAKDGIYVEIPCRDGPPYVCRYPRTAEGLAQALNILIENAAPETRTLVDHPAVRRPLPKFTGDQRDAAREVLKKMGIIGGGEGS